jgi:aminomethyltransferase
VKKTPFYDKHVQAGAKMVDFAGWVMPIQYPAGIIQEHLACRKAAGLFDVSHMGRFRIRGDGAADFLDYALTGFASGLAVGQSHYTILAQPDGGAIDDAWLYRFDADGFILVVNASNKDKDWQHLQSIRPRFSAVELTDLSDSVAMLALQGPKAEAILQSLLTQGVLPGPKRNAACAAGLAGCNVRIGRTGYTGEPMCFEIMMDHADTGTLWNALINNGAVLVGLGARDTLRLEASLPLYGHEMGLDVEGRVIPILASPATQFAIADMDKKNDFIGRAAIEKQLALLNRYKRGDFSDVSALPKRIISIRMLDKGIARQGAQVFYQGSPVGIVTSGTVTPYWKYGENMNNTGEFDQRAIALAYVDCRLNSGTEVEIDIRGRMLKAKIVRRNLKQSGSLAIAVFD